MGTVQLISRVRHQLGQPFGSSGSLDIPKLDQALDLAGDKAVEQGPLLPTRLGDIDFSEGGFPGDRSCAAVLEGRRTLADQKRTHAGPDRHPAPGPAGNPDVHQLGQLADQVHLGRFSPRRIAVDGHGPGNLDVEAVNLLKKAVGPFNAALDPAVRVLPNRLNLAGDPAGLIEERLGAEQGVLSPRRRRRVLGSGRKGGEDRVDLGEKTGVAAGVTEQRLDTVIKLVPHAHTRRLGPRVQTGRLQKPVGGQADAPNFYACAHALAGQGPLLADLAHIAGRIHVGDVVGDDAKLGLGCLQA